MAYDIDFGIFDHRAQLAKEDSMLSPEGKRPLALVELHPAEDWAGDKSELTTVFQSFLDSEVHERFGLSLVEFLELPVEWAQKILKLAQAHHKKKSRMEQVAAAAAADEIRNSGKPNTGR